MSIAEKLKIVAENQQKVYDAGFTAGQATGGDTDAAYQEGFDAGKQAEWDMFWDAFQENGKRTNYSSAFLQSGWSKSIFKPKYNIQPTSAADMFLFFNNNAKTVDEQVDFVQLANEQQIVFDFSQVTSFYRAFATGGISRLGTIDMSNATNTQYAFYGGYGSMKLHTIELLICSEKTVFYNDCFGAANSLKNLRIEGTIGSDISLKTSPYLTKASIESIMNALSNTATDKTATFNKTAVNNAFTTDEWNALAATKPNWTITLA